MRGPGPVLARLSRPRASQRVRIAVIADPHLAVDEGGTWKVLHRTCDRLATAVADVDALEADFALFVGDLTREGTEREIEAADAMLATVDARWAAVPGNHDVPKAFDAHDGVGVDRFAERFAPELPFAVEVGPVTLVGLNSASAPDGRLRATWGGRVSDDQLAWLDARLAEAETAVVACHHNLAPLPENPGGKWSRFPLENAAAVRSVLADREVSLAVTAHHHVPAVARHGPTVEVLSPAVCSFPQATLLVDIGPRGTTVRLVPLADRNGIRESWRHAGRGKPLGRGIRSLVEARLSELPLATRSERD